MNQTNQLITFNHQVTIDDMERKILGLARDGYRSTEIARLVNVSRITLSRRWLMLRGKLNSRTITETVVEAIRKQAISIYREGNNSEKVIHARSLR